MKFINFSSLMFCVFTFTSVSLFGAEVESDAVVETVVSCGVLEKLDKHGSPITLEFYHFTDGKEETLSKIVTPIFCVNAEAFDKELVMFREFFIDEETEGIKSDFAQAFEQLPPELQQATKEKIRVGGLDKDSRVAWILNSYQEGLCIKKWVTAHPYVVIAKEGSSVLGMALFCDTSLEEGLELPVNAVYLDELAVTPVAQGRGIGKLLVFSPLEVVPETTQIFLDTGVWNTTAQGFYKQVGFVDRDCSEVAHVGYKFVK